MKKILSLLTLMSLLASLTACGDNTENSVSESTVVTTETETQTETETTTTTTVTETETITTETITETEIITEPEITTTETEIIIETTVAEIPESVTEPAPVDTVDTIDTAVITEITQPVQPTLMHFVLNMETNCIHEDPQCTAAQKILPENYTELDIYDNELQNYNNIYWACGKCCSDNLRSILPKF